MIIVWNIKIELGPKMAISINTKKTRTKVSALILEALQLLIVVTFFD